MANIWNQRCRQRQQLSIFWTMVMQAIIIFEKIKRRSGQLPRAPHRNWDNEREMTLTRMFGTSDRTCHDLLRMKIATFERFCDRLRTYDLVDSRFVKVEEQVAIFLNTIRHDQRTRTGSFTFFRSSQTVSYYFHRVLQACLSFYRDVVNNATTHNSPYDKEKVKPWFQNFQDCVGAIDGTHVPANVPFEEQARYRNRKQIITQNVLVACTFDMKFTYVLAGWEGSAHDGRLLRSATLRQGHRLTIPTGKYYLADAGFPLVPGFLTPYRRTRYHRRDIEGHRPESKKELFNFRHSSLRNVVERIIGLLKKKIAYLRYQPYHDIDTQAKIVLACCAIHNFLRIYDEEDLCDDDYYSGDDDVNPGHVDAPEDDTPNATISFTAEAAWSSNRDTMVDDMWADYHPSPNADIDFD